MQEDLYIRGYLKIYKKNLLFNQPSLLDVESLERLLNIGGESDSLEDEPSKITYIPTALTNCIININMYCCIKYHPLLLIHPNIVLIK